MTKDQHHLIIYSPDGISIAHIYEDDAINQLADVINSVTKVAARQGFISSAEIVEAAEKFVTQLHGKDVTE